MVITSVVIRGFTYGDGTTDPDEIKVTVSGHSQYFPYDCDADADEQHHDAVTKALDTEDVIQDHECYFRHETEDPTYTTRYHRLLRQVTK